MTRIRSSFSILCALLIAACFLAPTTAFAGSNCKKIYLQVNNRSGDKIKVIDLDYYDPSDSKWRSIPVKNEVIPNGRVWQEIRNLKKVNQMHVSVRVKYRKPGSRLFSKKWGKVHQKQSSEPQLCSAEKQYVLTVN